MLYEEKGLGHFPDGDAVSSAKSVLARLDNSSLSSFHLKAMITSGMGFFTDAYDLFIIGVVLAIPTPLWHLNALDVSLLGSTSLIAAALGPLVAIVLLLAGINHDLIWRIMLALGAVPALATFYLRRQIAETPRFVLTMQGKFEDAARTVDMLTKKQNGSSDTASMTTQAV